MNRSAALLLLTLALTTPALAQDRPSPSGGGDGGGVPRAVTLATNGTLRVRGRSFFPRGAYHINALDMLKRETPSFDWTTERMMQALHDRGYNAVHTTAVPDRAFLDLAAKHDLMVMPELSGFIRDRARRWDELRRLVTSLRNEPQLLCWNLVDEPDPTMFRDTLEAYRILKVTDPDHPVHIDLRNPDWFRMFEPAYDILALDPHPLREKDPKPISQVGECLEEARRSTQKPAWLIAQTFAVQGAWRPLSPNELRHIVYQGLVGGAKGLWYHTLTSGEPYAMPSGMQHWFLPHSPLWKTTAQLNREIRSFEPYLLEGQPTTEIAVAGLSREKGSLLRTAAWRRGDRYLVLAVNNGQKSVQLLFRRRGRGLLTDSRGRTLPELIPRQGVLAIEL
jgi:hypothetical protein